MNLPKIAALVGIIVGISSLIVNWTKIEAYFKKPKQTAKIMLTGTIKDPTTLRPLAQVQVNVRGTDNIGLRGYTDQDGLFSLEASGKGIKVLSLDVYHKDFEVNPEKQFSVDFGQADQVYDLGTIYLKSAKDAQVRRGPSISPGQEIHKASPKPASSSCWLTVVVTTKQGEPVENARIELENVELDNSLFTDQNGRCRLKIDKNFASDQQVLTVHAQKNNDSAFDYWQRCSGNNANITL